VQMNTAITQSNPVNDKAVRGILDVISFSDFCSGWRTLDAVVASLSEKLNLPIELHQLVAYLNTSNNDDRLFESAMIDGERCLRSHKFDRNRDAYLQAMSEVRRQVKANPEQQQEILESSSFLLVKALLPKHVSMTQPSRLVCI
jgi:hypothetical protein